MTTNSLAATEAECAEGRTAPRVSLSDIEANIAHVVGFTAAAVAEIPSERRRGTLLQDTPASHDVLTIVIVTLRNGFTIIGKSAPASAANFDAELGHKLAYEDAVRQVWPLMGYELRQQLHYRALLDRPQAGVNGDLTPIAGEVPSVDPAVVTAAP